MPKLDTFTQAYIDCALWSSTYGDNDEHNLDDGEHELAPETIAAMQADCAAFQAANDETIAACPDQSWVQAGHDFWLTRNDHGAGFWDGDWPEPQATILTNSAHSCGERNLYIGDDGLIYQS